MKLITFEFRRTEYLRTPTCGGMDSEPAGTKIGYGTHAVVIPETTPMYLDMAQASCRYGMNDDSAFEITRTEITNVHAIVHSVQTRL